MPTLSPMQRVSLSQITIHWITNEFSNTMTIQCPFLRIPFYNIGKARQILPRNEGPPLKGNRFPAVASYAPSSIRGLKDAEMKLWCACGLSKKQPWCDGSHSVNVLRHHVRQSTSTITQSVMSVCLSVRLSVAQSSIRSTIHQDKR